MYFVFLVFVVAFVVTCVLYHFNTTVFVFVVFVTAEFNVWTNRLTKHLRSDRAINTIELKSYKFWLVYNFQMYRLYVESLC